MSQQPTLIKPKDLIVRKDDLLKLYKPSLVANALGISRQAVDGWGEIIPEGQARKLVENNKSIPHEYV